jgi:D-glucosaminate-specific PTS system IID component
MKSGLINQIITGSSILGLFMMGALSSAYVKVGSPLQFTMENAANPIVLQNILDRIVPGLLPLIAILGIYYYFTHKGQNYNKVILILLAISMVGSLLGILG